MPNPEDPREKFRRLVDSEADTQAEPPAEQAGAEKNTPVVRHPAIDENGMPLPRRVEEIDMGATRVTPSALRIPPPAHASGLPPARLLRNPPGRPFHWPKARSCLLRGLIVLVFIIVAVGLVMVAAGIYEYYSIAASLPSVSDLQQRASQFETTRILDRNGDVLYEILDPQAGRRTYVPLNEISPTLVAATIATEDKDYYSHGGFDPLAIVRAFWQNFTQRRNSLGRFDHHPATGPRLAADPRGTQPADLPAQGARGHPGDRN